MSVPIKNIKDLKASKAVLTIGVSPEIHRKILAVYYKKKIKSLENNESMKGFGEWLGEVILKALAL